jgi:hypothetical protein
LRIGCALPEAYPAASGHWMSPSNEEPSCRSLSPRVLSRSRYDAHWLRQASSVSTPSRPSQRPPDNGYPLSYPSSFRLQSTTRHVLPLSPGWDPGTSLGFCPFSAIITGRDKRDFRPRSSPLTGFHNLTAGLSSRMTYGFIPPRKHS